MNARIAIVVAEFNKEITGNLLACALSELRDQGMKLNQIKTVWVPGAYELPYAALQLAKTKKFDAVICFGCVIKGDTSHDVHVAGWAAIGIGRASLATGVPIMFGVLTPNNETQARKRSRPGPLNRGKEVAEAALAMIRLKRSKDI
jgi:6,7-dimethyl-8-ribityllumazine synthase